MHLSELVSSRTRKAHSRQGFSEHPVMEPKAAPTIKGAHTSAKKAVRPLKSSIMKKSKSAVCGKKRLGIAEKPKMPELAEGEQHIAQCNKFLII